MVVLVTENMPEGEKGWFTRWLIEVKAGVFVGKISNIIRSKIWEKIENIQISNVSALMIYSSNTEQGFSMKMKGFPKRHIVDFEGLIFVGVRIDD